MSLSEISIWIHYNLVKFQNMGTQITISQFDTELVICIRLSTVSTSSHWANWGWTCALAKGTGTSFPQPQHWRWVMDGFSSSITVSQHIKVMEYHRQSSDVFLLVIKYLFHSHADQFITLMSFSGLLVDNQSVNEVKLGDYKKMWSLVFHLFFKLMAQQQLWKADGVQWTPTLPLWTQQLQKNVTFKLIHQCIYQQSQTSSDLWLNWS